MLFIYGRCTHQFKIGSYSLSQNCYGIFVSSRPLNVGVHDLVTESQ